MVGVDRLYVPKGEYKDWLTLAEDGDEYDSTRIAQKDAYEYALESGDMDYDELLQWYYEQHPNKMPVIADVLKDQAAVIEFFYQEWVLMRPHQLIKGQK